MRFRLGLLAVALMVSTSQKASASEEVVPQVQGAERFLALKTQDETWKVLFLSEQSRERRVEVEALRSKLLKLTVKHDESEEVHAIGGPLRKRFYTLCLGSTLSLGDEELLVGWRGFLDSTRMMGSQSWHWFWYGVSVWGRY